MDIHISPILDRIRAAGVLRVGTTGDYTPFSLLQPDGSYRGADIEMASDLGERLGVGIEFVSTVWVDLLDDFLADHFDIAMGGVTVTVARAERAYFSVPTFVDGKRPLARRENRDRFTLIAAIDQPNRRSRKDVIALPPLAGRLVPTVKPRQRLRCDPHAPRHPRARGTRRTESRRRDRDIDRRCCAAGWRRPNSPNRWCT